MPMLLARMKPLNVGLGLLGLALLAWLVYANVSVLQGWQERNRLGREGVTVTVPVTSTDQLALGRDTAYQVIYTLRPTGGAAVQRQERVDFSTYINARDSRQVQVRYLPAAPERAQILGNQTGGFGAVYVVLLDLMVIGFGIALIRAWRR